VVTAFFDRLGNLGVLIVAGALLLGGLAGGAVVHQYERAAAESAASQHDENDGHKPDKQKGQGKQKHDKKQHQQDETAETQTD
jgi:hypothetical protein